MTKSDSIAKITPAIGKVQAQIAPAKKEGVNTYFNNAKYATLSSVWDACREPLKANEITVIQLPGKDDLGYYLETILLHVSTEFISGKMYFHCPKDDPQGIGSAITYARRYSLAAALGICPEDDDGEASMIRVDKARESSARVVASRPSKPQEEASTVEFKGDWRTVKVHFGAKLKDKTLKELNASQLKWLNEEWQPGAGKYPVTDKDRILKAAVAQALDHRSIDQTQGDHVDPSGPEDDLGWK